MPARVVEQVESVQIACDADVIIARQRTRELAQEIGFTSLNQTRIVTAVSELGRNIVVHSGVVGNISLLRVRQGDEVGLRVVCEDGGRGIGDVDLALQDGFTTIASLGLGLGGARRLVDEFEITSAPGQGARVVIVKWL
jgi:serine/threonine-protein kinase RsbT